MIDNLFLLAVGALGWGLSLTTYPFIARRAGWPMGALQLDFPVIPGLIGLASMAVGLYFASHRGMESDGWQIMMFAAMLAIFWTGFLRVGSQITLFLAPLAAILLSICWLRAPLEYETASSRDAPRAFISASSQYSAARP